MSDTNAPEEVKPTTEEGEEQKPDPSIANKKKKLIVALVVLLVVVAAGIFGFLKIQQKKAADQEAEAHKAASEANNELIYLELEDMIVNLNTQGKGVSFLKLKITLELEGKENQEAITKYTPKVKDALQLYLRELKPEDMQGSVGLYRLKDELLLRINKIIYPAHVNDILFKDILVQ